MTDDDEWARGMFAAINIRERINAYLGRAEEIVTREPYEPPRRDDAATRWSPGMSATIYAATDEDGDALVIVDCDACHATISTPTLAIGSEWLARAIADHVETCGGKP